MQIKTLCENDIDLVYEFERSQLPKNDMQAEMRSWSSSWRQESLQHYLPNGWSFGFYSDSGQLEGYFLAQPLLFYRGMTQSLWVENLSFKSEDAAALVVETAYKLARSKHFQGLLFYNCDQYKKLIEKYNPQVLSEDTLLVKTTKS